jgi:hypothetical protein
MATEIFQQQVGNLFRHAFHQRKTPAFNVAITAR